MINIYSDNISNRLIYTLNVIFKHILKIEYTLVDLKTFNSQENTKINYSHKKLENCITIKPHSLLFEKDITEQQISVEWKNKSPFFFKTSDNASINYDILACTFFMVSRYEEYFPKKLDKHNRFIATESLAFQYNFLEIPVVNFWAEQLKIEILKGNPKFKFTRLEYNYINSIDIDVAYTYKGKGLFRFIAGSFKSLLFSDIKDLKNRFDFLFTKKDLYNTYHIINKLQEKFKTKNYYFINLGNYSKLDKNLSYKNPILQELIKSIVVNNNNKVGIHPSYASNKNSEKIKLEKERLDTITNFKTTKSRQHFLMLNFPRTYELLIENNIKHDYSMGYADKVGFRAGICSTYPFFNVEKNKEEGLLITPFQIMDGTLNQYEKFSPKDATKKIIEIISEVKKVNGTFVSLWHNSSLCDENEWENWTGVYENLVKRAKSSKD